MRLRLHYCSIGSFSGLLGIKEKAIKEKAEIDRCAEAGRASHGASQGCRGSAQVVGRMPEGWLLQEGSALTRKGAVQTLRAQRLSPRELEASEHGTDTQQEGSGFRRGRETVVERGANCSSPHGRSVVEQEMGMSPASVSPTLVPRGIPTSRHPDGPRTQPPSETSTPFPLQGLSRSPRALKAVSSSRPCWLPGVSPRAGLAALPQPSRGQLGRRAPPPHPLYPPRPENASSPTSAYKPSTNSLNPVWVFRTHL